MAPNNSTTDQAKQKQELTSFNEWSWSRPGTPLGQLPPVEAAQLAWLGRASFVTASATPANVSALDTPAFWKLCRKFSTAPEGSARDGAKKHVLDAIAASCTRDAGYLPIYQVYDKTKNAYIDVTKVAYDTAPRSERRIVQELATEPESHDARTALQPADVETLGWRLDGPLGVNFSADERVVAVWKNAPGCKVRELVAREALGRAAPGAAGIQSTKPANFGEEVTRLCGEIRQTCSMAWRDSLFEQLMDLIDPIHPNDDPAVRPTEATKAMSGLGPVDEMRVTLTVQLDKLIEIAERFARRMIGVDEDERTHIGTAVRLARQASAPYKGDGPLRFLATDGLDGLLHAADLVRTLSRISMSLAADLVKGSDRLFEGRNYLDREAVMERVVQWRTEWDATAPARAELERRSLEQGSTTRTKPQLGASN